MRPSSLRGFLPRAKNRCRLGPSRDGWSADGDDPPRDPLLVEDPRQDAPSAPGTESSTRASRSIAAAASTFIGAAGALVLGACVHRVAAADPLRVTEELAVDLIHAAGTGVVITMLSYVAGRHDRRPADAAWNAVIGVIVNDAPALPAGDTAASAIALRTSLPSLTTLTPAERALMAEWLDRIPGCCGGRADRTGRCVRSPRAPSVAVC